MAVKIGAVFAVRTADDVAYVQWTHRDRELGPLLRVLPGLHTGSVDIEMLVAGPEIGWIFADIPRFHRRREVEYLGQFPVPESAIAYPTLRMGMQLGPPLAPGFYRVQTENGLQEIRLNAHEAESLPAFALADFGGMIHQIYRLNERDPKSEGSDSIDSNQATLVTEEIQHFLYFKSESAARGAAAALSAVGGGMSVEDQESDGWVVVYGESGACPSDALQLRLQAVAREFAGEYDGYEKPV